MARMRASSGTPPRREITLDGFYAHFGLEDCLIFMGRAMERAGWEIDELPEYQHSLIRDLRQPLDEETLADMLTYWQFDLDKLYERGRRGWGRGKAPAKPQIDVWVEVTSKGNLKAEWLPRGATLHNTPPGTDFTWFYRSESRTVSFGGRPSNELFFLHGFQSVHVHLRHAFKGPTAALNTPLLTASAGVVARLKERLSYHFDVRMKTDVVMEWGEVEFRDKAKPWRQFRDKLLSWEIVDPEARLRAAELDELANLEDRLGFSEEALLQVKARIEAGSAGKSGPPPAPHTLSDRLARELKKQGLAATKGKVERALQLLGRHRAPSNVVPLRGQRHRG